MTQEARERYEAWLANLHPAVAPAFFDLTRVMKDWRAEIFCDLGDAATIAHGETLKGISQAVSQASRGYSFEVLRAKLLFGENRAR